MSEPISTVPAGEPVSDFNKVTWAEPAPEPVADTSVVPDPVAAPEPEPADPDFNFVTLENGDIEARLATGEVYKGKSEREVLSKIAKGKVEASRHIQTLRQQPAPQQIDANTVPVDQSSKVLLDLLAPALKAKSGDELLEKFSRQDAIIQQYEMRETAAQFFTEVQDFVKTQANTDIFGATLDQFGLPFTVANAKLVHGYLKANGLYQAPPAEIPRAADGKFAPRTNSMPPPPNGSSAPASQPVTEQDIWSMSREQFEKHRAGLGTFQ